MKRVKITEDGFVWHVLTEIETHIRRGGYVGIEVGFIDDNQN